MKITLTHTEIVEALMKAIEEKTNYTIGECVEDDCFFTGVDGNDKEVEVVRVEFHCTSF